MDLDAEDMGLRHFRSSLLYVKADLQNCQDANCQINVHSIGLSATVAVHSVFRPCSSRVEHEQPQQAEEVRTLLALFLL